MSGSQTLTEELVQLAGELEGLPVPAELTERLRAVADRLSPGPFVDGKGMGLSDHLLLELGWKECLPGHPEHGWTNYRSQYGFGGVMYARPTMDQVLRTVYSKGHADGDAARRKLLKEALG